MKALGNGCFFRGENRKACMPSHVIVYGGDIGYKFDCGVTYIGNSTVERMRNSKRR